MRTIRIGLFGLGNVGCGVVNIVKRNRELIQARLGAELVVHKAVVAHPEKLRPVALDDVGLSDDPAFILDDPEIDIVVELIGGTTVARDVVVRALQAGKPVVTANKALLAEYPRDIFPLVYEQGLALGMEASVAGGIPVLRSLKEGLSGDHIVEITGIVNGTSNYILTQMGVEGMSFEDALAEAQQLGYAEADPTFDVEGHDAAHKLAVLVNLAYGTMVPYEAIHKEGISRITPMDITYAHQLGYTIKLLAIGKVSDGKVEARVHPTLVANDHMLATVKGVFNAVFITGDNVDATMSFGRGAGAAPTGSAVVSDVIDIARNTLAGIKAKIPPLSYTREHLREIPVMPIREIAAEYYLRFEVLDRAGVLARITTVLGDHGISIQSFIQPAQAEHPYAPVQVIIVTHRAKEQAIQDSIAMLQPQDFILGPTQVIRIERFGT